MGTSTPSPFPCAPPVCLVANRLHPSAPSITMKPSTAATPSAPPTLAAHRRAVAAAMAVAVADVWAPLAAVAVRLWTELASLPTPSISPVSSPSSSSSTAAATAPAAPVAPPPPDTVFEAGTVAVALLRDGLVADLARRVVAIYLLADAIGLGSVPRSSVRGGGDGGGGGGGRPTFLECAERDPLTVALLELVAPTPGAPPPPPAAAATVRAEQMLVAHVSLPAGGH